ncbi:sulfatase-like hydrolase/transferase [Puniceicoccus vermicola]|uniref:Sulfatase-like hydrolase/transferase n=1 Tax=Puniceicoccus vermicola TaxID=388746 RepID=A0A7X1AZ28_9BACT|nr:sulfatase-like hydrolase/transferase [Puniceicoccus vermicola]
MGLLENTLIVYDSDHGCHSRTRGHEYKNTCQESSIRVPGFIRGPGVAGVGRRERSVMHNRTDELAEKQFGRVMAAWEFGEYPEGLWHDR